MSGKKSPQCRFRMARKKLPQVFRTMSFVKIAAQQALNGVWHFTSRTTITHGTAKAGVLTHCAAKAEVISVLNAAVNFELLAFQPDIRNAMLATTVRAAGNVQFQLLIKLRNAFFQLFNQPAREGFGFCYCQLAKFAAGQATAPAKTAKP